MGGASGGSGFPFKMPGMRPSDHGSQKNGGKKCPGNPGKSLKKRKVYGNILVRDI